MGGIGCLGVSIAPSPLSFRFKAGQGSTAPKAFGVQYRPTETEGTPETGGRRQKECKFEQ